MELQSVRSLLFVPATKLEKMPKMRDSGADLLVIDLEDSIAPDQKDDMRRELTRFFHKTPDDSAASLIGVRINALRTFNGLLDVMTVFGCKHMPNVLILPKVQHVAELEIITGWFEQIGETLPVIVLAENLEIWDNLDAIAAHPSVAGIMLGGIDLAAELGCDTSWEAMSPYRAKAVRAARRHHKLSVDMPWFDLSDAEGLRRETLRSKSLGFDARAAIHPGQVPIIQDCFTPTPEELAEARTIIDLFESSGSALATHNGKVIELPVVKKCYQLLMRAPLKSSP
jgi:citrate lyase beta subunit